MMPKIVPAPHLGEGKTVKMGRKRPVAPGPRMHLKNYLRMSMPSAPASCDYSSAAMASLSQMYMNDQLGCCVIAGGYHVVGTETGNAGDLFTATEAEILADYGAIGGYVQGDANTDQGCDEQTALGYWQSHGFANGTKLLGWLAVDASNQEEVMAALFLFENLFFGIELPDAWVNPMPSAPGFVWDVAGAADPNNGHCIIGVGYDSAGVKVDTWGMFGTLTWAAVAVYCAANSGGQLFVMLTQDQITKGQGKAPNGVDWTSLIADFDAMGGSVPVPASTPVPAPPATGPVSLAQAQKWVDNGLQNGHVIMTRGQAITAAKAGLAKNWPTS